MQPVWLVSLLRILSLCLLMLELGYHTSSIYLGSGELT